MCIKNKNMKRLFITFFILIMTITLYSQNNQNQSNCNPLIQLNTFYESMILYRPVIKSDQKLIKYNMNNFLLYHHLGFGDHIAMNGLIRYLYKIKNFNFFYLFVKLHNYKNVNFMFKDLKKLKLIQVYNDEEALNKFKKFKGEKIKNIIYDTNKYYKYGDDIFYLNLNLNPKIRFDNFYIERNIQKEKEIYNKLTLNIPDKKYIFIHDDKKRNYNIDIKRHNIKLPIIYNDYYIDFFDMIYTIEKSQKCYMITSSFISYIIHSGLYKKKEIYVDNKARKVDFKDYLIKYNIKIV